MTKTEFESLKFGDVVYDSMGRKALVLSNRMLSFKGGSGSSHSLDFFGHRSLHLTKPKKTVKKTIECYLQLCELDSLLKGTEEGSSELFDLCASKQSCMADDVKVTITYEREE